MNEPTAPASREQLFEQLERALRQLEQKAGQAAKEGKVCTMQGHEAQALAEGLRLLAGHLCEIREKLGDAVLDELEQLTADGSMLEALQRVAFEGWRSSEFLPIFEQGAKRSAQQLGRPLVVMWHPAVQTCMVYDAAHMPPGTALGWLQVSLALPDGSLHRAPSITVEARQKGSGLPSRIRAAT